MTPETAWTMHASRTLIGISMFGFCALEVYGQTANTGVIAGTVSDPVMRAHPSQ
jgi:hypothetical protein